MDTAPDEDSTMWNSGDVIKKPNYVTSPNKLDNHELLHDWHLFVVTGRKQGIDGPISMIWSSNPLYKARKIDKVPASVHSSRLQFIGSDGNFQEFKHCSGRIADVMIWDGVLSKSDIIRLDSIVFNSYYTYIYNNTNIEFTPTFKKKKKNQEPMELSIAKQQNKARIPFNWHWNEQQLWGQSLPKPFGRKYIITIAIAPMRSCR
ncbi:hypothetical protein RFI_24298 [Reticulomyxa filosa]|uniref:Uncharacterized protein n=1 Tax=Reticulomyxa filosa TaxID=46433 RepID=X6MHC6_RETFI|nr:hypothetical protein RFI_24298 [Reticulomyxa filosa]|eukprot:ETO13076.1 hypothetical protein RFI_24298 [Reticulomyxa filosa]